VEPTARTLDEHATQWLPRRQRNDKGLRATTMAGYEYYIRDDIAPSALGRMKLSDIRRYDVSEFVDDLTKAGRGTVTVRRLVTLLGTIFASAVKDELITTNPARGVDRPKLDGEEVKP
jgi:site-specific recombinase XerD